jgi:hypothetical protein
MSNSGDRKNISPWGLTLIACAGSAILLVLNEIFASGSEAATKVINIQFIIFMVAALVKSFSKNYSRAYRLRFFSFVFILVSGVVSLSFYNRYKTREWERRNLEEEAQGLPFNSK